MAFCTQKYLPVGFGLLSTIGAALLLFIMFKAGCAGDPKEDRSATQFAHCNWKALVFFLYCSVRPQVALQLA